MSIQNIFTTIYLVNNTTTNLENIHVRIEGIEKETVWKKLKKGTVVSKFLSTELHKGEKDIFLYYVDGNNVKHEYKILEKFDMKIATKFKVRIQDIKENGELTIEVEQETHCNI